jgi:hypothetical protein
MCYAEISRDEPTRCTSLKSPEESLDHEFRSVHSQIAHQALIDPGRDQAPLGTSSEIIAYDI